MDNVLLTYKFKFLTDSQLSIQLIDFEYPDKSNHDQMS